MNKVVDTITIEKLEGGVFNIVQGDKSAEELSYDEMLGLVSTLTMPEKRYCFRWMRTKEQHEALRNSLVKSTEGITDVEFEAAPDV